MSVFVRCQTVDRVEIVAGKIIHVTVAIIVHSQWTVQFAGVNIEAQGQIRVIERKPTVDDRNDYGGRSTK